MAIGFGGVGKQPIKSSKFNVVKSDGTLLAQCASKEEAEEKKKELKQSINDELQIKELKLL